MVYFNCLWKHLSYRSLYYCWSLSFWYRNVFTFYGVEICERFNILWNSVVSDVQFVDSVMHWLIRWLIEFHRNVGWMFNKEMVFRATRSSRSVDLMLSRKIRSLSRVLSLSSSSSSSAKRRVVSQSVRALMVVVFNRLRCVALTRDFSTCTMYMYVFLCMTSVLCQVWTLLVSSCLFVLSQV